MTRQELEQKWDRITSVPLLVLAFVFLAFYAAPIINPELDPKLVAFLDVSQTVIWALFVIDFVGRFTLAEKKLPFLKRNVIELIAVVLPFFRPLRALRLLSVATIGFRRFGGKLRNRITFYVFGAAFMLWFITGLAVTEAERGVEGANIANVWQGWWWSFITMATVGYGDKFPITPEGQWVAVIIVLTGIALLGTISAFLASWFIDNVEKVETEILEDTVKTNESIADLLNEVKSLRKEVQKLSKQVSSKD
jgi:voltage-gated potassium channel